jgi:bla regulator protein BlaR1
MTNLLSWFASEHWTRLAFVLLHSLWQGGVASVVLWYWLRKLPAKRPETRYAVALLTLMALVFSAFVTWSVLDTRAARPASDARSHADVGLVPAQRTAHPTSVLSAREENLLASASQSSSHDSMALNLSTQKVPTPAWMPWAMLFWLAGCGVMSLRLFAQWLDLGRLTGRCRPVLEESIHEILRRFQKVLGLCRPILVLTGEHVRGPAIYGMLTPKLLLPPALLLGVPREQLEAIIAHELGHIRRYDYLVNLLQQCVETVLFSTRRYGGSTARFASSEKPVVIGWPLN